MKIIAGLFLLVVLFSSFRIADSLSGTWQYAGDITNGVKSAAPTDYTLQRTYNNTNYEAVVLERAISLRNTKQVIIP